jgi:hypothetical protein
MTGFTIGFVAGLKLLLLGSRGPAIEGGNLDVS